MKQLFLLFAAIFLCGAAGAQAPTVTDIIVKNLAGKTVYTYFLQSPTFNEGSAGASQTWDFSSHIFDQPFVSNYITPNTAYGYNSFTSSTDVLHTANGGSNAYDFHRLTGNVYSVIGYSDQPSQGGHVIYDNAEDNYRFPMTMGTTFTDTFHATSDLGVGEILGTSGSLTAQVDAYGTLKTPAGTFPNTLRVKITKVARDTTYFQGQPTDNEETNTVSYSWIAQSQPGLLLMHITSGSGGGNSLDYAYYQAATPSAVNEVADEQIQFSVFPNPSNGSIHLNFAEYLPGAAVSLFDVTGREVYTKQLSGSPAETINAREIPKGIYLLKISSENGTASKRVVIE